MICYAIFSILYCVVLCCVILYAIFVVLMNQIADRVRDGSGYTIKLGDKLRPHLCCVWTREIFKSRSRSIHMLRSINYADTFKFYLTHHTAGTSTCLHIWYLSRLEEHWQESRMDPRPNPHYSPETSVKAVFVNAFIHFVCFLLVLRNSNPWRFPVNSLAGHSVEFCHHAYRFGGTDFCMVSGQKSLRHTVNAKQNCKLLTRIALMLSEASFLISTIYARIRCWALLWQRKDLILKNRRANWYAETTPRDQLLLTQVCTSFLSFRRTPQQVKDNAKMNKQLKEIEDTSCQFMRCCV